MVYSVQSVSPKNMLHFEVISRRNTRRNNKILLQRNLSSRIGYMLVNVCMIAFASYRGYQNA